MLIAFYRPVNTYSNLEYKIRPAQTIARDSEKDSYVN